ncbi:excisionase family DNA binding protein [Rubricella aquisinus]|uniref:Excisionase family DNA binding protein n=1 Tax=Rubricella aquisinus TaxID=2028108 RepID=A0A840WL24_9RHOB|nr:excisionase family DNA-binding protein [Rubricella aquisinus]MBB5515798.1 excisionase family DNA binding protein [Rubricella aquisinus]
MSENLPFTPDTLARRWHCSSETIRQMVKRGDLRGFRVGRMFRIPYIEVMEHERCKSTLDDCAVDSASIGQIHQEDDGVISLRHAPERKQNQKPVRAT